MPSDTFFRLPEEKRQRLIDASWEEFIRIRFSEVSINKIIQNAHIPRGSFYQYFEDKNDLFAYLVRPLQKHFFDLARQEVELAKGDLFSAPLRIYDRFFQSGEQFNQDLNRCVQIIQRNPDSEFHTLFCAPDSPISSFSSLIDTTPLRRKDPVFIHEVFHLFIFILGSSIIDTLNHPEQLSYIREQLRLRVEILMQGCSTASTLQGGTL